MNPPQNDIAFSEAIRRILRKRRLVAISIAVGVAVGTLVAFTARPIFVSVVVMLPQSHDSQNGSGGITKRLSGLASAAGIAIGGGGEGDARDVAIETLSSYQTLSTFIAAEGIEKIVLEQSARGNLFDFMGSARRPSMWQAVREFNNHLVVTPVKESNLVRLSIEWYDPATASAWANHLVAFADAKLRAQALETADGRFNYLQRKLESNPIVSVQEVISGMMENELRIMTTAGADKEFTFRILDPAIPAELPTRPHRLLIVTALAFCGLFLGSLIAIVFNRSAPARGTPPKEAAP